MVRAVRTELGLDSGMVVPHFVLHLRDSLGSGYSPRFPVFDNLVWTAVVCLYDAATEVPARLGFNDRRSRSLAYERFPCDEQSTRYEVLTAVFDAHRASGVDIPRLERALFVAGGLVVAQDIPTVSEARELIGEVQDGRCGGYYSSERPEQ